MNWIKRILALMTVLALCFASAAASAATVTKDGLEVTLTTDKASYAAGEKIALTVTLTNRGEAPIKSVDVSCLLPAGCGMDGAQSASRTITMLEPGSSVTVHAAIKADCNPELPEEPVLPVTGDDSNLLLWAGLLGVCVLAFAKMGRRARMQMMALVLCAVTLFGGMQTARAQEIILQEESYPLGAIRTGDEALYRRALAQAGRMAAKPMADSGFIVSETVEIAGVRTELAVKVSGSAGEKLSAAYLSDSYRDRPLSETISQTTTVYDGTIGSGMTFPETAHDYPAHADELYIIGGSAAAEMITLYFDEESQLESGWDCVIVYDMYGNYLTEFTGTELSGAVFSVPGSRVYLRLLSDSSMNYYGFSVYKAIAHKTAKLTNVDNDGKGGVVIKWSLPYGYDGYELLRAPIGEDGAVGAYETIAYSPDRRAHSHTDTSCALGQAYAYKLAYLYTVLDAERYIESPAIRRFVMKTTALTGGVADTTASTPRISLTWNAVEHAAGYDVYRSETESGGYTLAGSTAGTAYTDTPPEKKDYYYRIRPYTQYAGEKYTTAYSPAARFGYSGLPKLTGLKSRGTAAGRVKLMWDAVTGAEGYQVYRSETGVTGTFARQPSADTNSGYYYCYTGKVNYFKVRAYRTVGGKTEYGPFSAVLKVYPLAPPKNLRADMKNGSIHLFWDAVAGAQKYDIFYSAEPDGTYAKYTTVSNPYVSLHNLPASLKKVYLKIDSKRADSGVTSLSAVSGVYKTVIHLRPPTDVSLRMNTEGALAAEWTAATSRVTGYELYVSRTGVSGSFTRKATTSSLSKTLAALTADGLNYIKVRTYYNQSGTKLYSPFSPTVSCRTTPAAFRALYAYVEEADNGNTHYAPMDKENWKTILAHASPCGMACDASSILTNPTEADMLEGIASMNEMEDANDITLVYITCHGVSSTEGSPEYFGALRMKDKLMTLGTLADALDALDGRVVIILTACGSGAGVHGTGETLSAAEAAAMDAKLDRAVIEAFAGRDRRTPSADGLEESYGELGVANKFYVITSNKAHMNGYSYNNTVNGRTILLERIMNGVVSVGGGMPADTDQDGIATLHEMYEYLNGPACQPIRIRQDDGSWGEVFMYPQVYPRNSSFPIFQLR